MVNKSTQRHEHQQPAEDRPYSHDKLLNHDVLLIMTATFFFMASNMIGQPIIAGYAGSLGAGGVVMGLIAALMSITSLFCRPIAGNLADKTNKRRLAVIGALLYVTADIGYAIAPNEAVLMIARVINGVGFACASVCLATWLSMLLPLSRMGAGMSLYGMMNALAQAVGPAVGIKCSTVIGYRFTYIIAAVLAAGMVTSVLLVRDPGRPLRHKLEPADSSQQSASTPARLAPVGSSRVRGLNRFFEIKVIPIAVIFMMFGIPYFATQSFLVEYCSDRHLTALSVSLFFPLYAIAILLLRILMRNWFDTKSFLFFLIMSTAGNVVMLLALTVMTNDFAMLVAAIGMAFGYGIMSSVTQSQAVLVAGKERSGMANTTYYAGIDLGMSIGPLLGGVLYAAAPINLFFIFLLITMPVAWMIFGFFHRQINIKKHPVRDI